MSLKIVHCADIHIGVSFSHLGCDLARVRSEEMRAAFMQIINFCKEKDADILLICGDLFDTPSPTKKDSDFVKNALTSIPSTEVYIACGNHDYMCAKSPFAKENYFPENVHIFPCFEHSFELSQKNAVIWGKSYSSASIEPSFADCSFDSSKINIMCLHGDTQTASDYNIISTQILGKLSPSYAAFGHIHNGEIFTAGNVKCAYSGTPEPHSFGDDGSTGFIYVQISPDEALLTPVSFSARRYHNISLDITEKTEAQIIAQVTEAVNPTDLYRLTLTGEYSDGAPTDIAYIQKALSSSVFYIDISDESSPGYDFDKIELEESLRGAFLRELRELTHNEEEYIIAAKAGLDALCGRVPELGGAQ